MTGFATSSHGLLLDLEEQILSGDLPAGAKLPSERQLAEQYGVSRPTVREALRTLAERQLVTISPGRGSFVRPGGGGVSSATLGLAYRRRDITPRQVVQARVMVEREAAALAADHAGQGELDQLEQLLRRLEESSNRLEHVQLDLAFHYGIARASHNPVIEVLFGSITPLATELMLRSVGDPEVRARSHPFHRKIFEAIREGRAADAAEAVSKHLYVAEDTYGADYDRSLDAMAHRALEHLLGPGTSLDDVIGRLLPFAQD